MLLRAALWTVVILGFGCVALVGAARALGESLPVEEIAYMSYARINPDIHLLDARQGITINLTRHPAWDAAPAWSPDGEWIAFASDRSGRQSIYVIHHLGGSVRRITPNVGGAYTAPRWMQDGARLLFFEVGRNDVIYTVNADGSDFRQIAGDDPAASIVIDLAIDPGGISRSRSPDGSRIAFMTYRNQVWGVYVASRADRTDARLLATIGRYGDTPVWSPDGSRVAFIAYRGGMTDLFVANADDGALARLTHDRSVDAFPVWRPR